MKYRTNSKQARQNIRAYIMANFDGSSYDIETPSTFKETAAVILSIFRDEIPALGSYARMSEGQRFEVWAKGLPSILDTCYYYNRSAVDDLGAILEESDEEKNQYSEDQAATLLTALIYRELIKGAE